MKYIFNILILFTIVIASPKNAVPDTLMVEAVEHESFHRINISLNTKHDSLRNFFEPQIVSIDTAGLFLIKFKFLHPTVYKQKTNRHFGEIMPIDLRIIRKDSRNYHLQGRTNEFKSIVSSKILGENAFQFDVVPPDMIIDEEPMDTSIIIFSEFDDFIEDTLVYIPDIAEVEIDNSVNESDDKIHLEDANYEEIVSYLGSNRETLIKALVIAGVILFAILLVVFTIYVFKEKNEDNPKEQVDISVQDDYESLPELNISDQVQNEIVSVSSREITIKKLMEEQRISYDEASMYVDLHNPEYGMMSR